MSKKENVFSGYTYGQLLYGVQVGSIAESEIRKEYSRLRKNVRRRIAAIESSKADIGFLPHKKPSFRSLPEIGKDLDILLHEFYSLSRFNEAKSSTVIGRIEQRKAAVKSLQEQGLTFVTVKNYKKWREFYDWFKHSDYAAFFDSTSRTFEDVFKNTPATPSEWEMAFAKQLQIERPEDYKKLMEIKAR